MKQRQSSILDNKRQSMIQRPSMIGEDGTRILPEMFKHRLMELSESTVSRLQNVWREAGYEDTECHRLLGDVFDKLKACCESELEAEQSILDHAKAEVEIKTRLYETFCRQLGREFNLDHLVDCNTNIKLTDLEQRCDEIGEEVNEREGLLTAELTAILELVTSIGEDMPEDAAFSGPKGTPELSDVRLELMKKERSDLEGRKAQRVAEMVALLEECKQLVTDMVLAEEGFKTVEDGESFIAFDEKLLVYVQNGEFAFGTTQTNVTELECRLRGLHSERNKRREELTGIGAEIAALWTLLRVPPAEREVFQSSVQMNLSMSTLSKGYDELQRLRHVRIQEFSKIVSNIRADIDALWLEAGIEDDAAREREFPGFFAELELLEDSAVDEHETYYSALKLRVAELRPLLQKISRRETVVNERIELEHVQLNPDRLKERGPHAREARKREEGMASRVKNLDKITAELSKQLLEWEKSNGPFLWGGERYVERIAVQDDAYTEIRDSLRATRKKNNEQKNKPEASQLQRQDSKAKLNKAASVASMRSMGDSARLDAANLALLSKSQSHSLSASSSNDENAPKANNSSNNNGHSQKQALQGLKCDSSESISSTATEVITRERPSTATVVRPAARTFD